jgi:RsiW-degrading membrane proteinase PrsW (M82 family)
MLVTGILTAVAVPLLFLALVRWLDLYASGSFKVVLLCAGWGAVAFLLALQMDAVITEYAGFTLTITLFGPIVEEILKSLVLVYATRRRDFTYFVDGAVYGFAAGAGFALLENLYYFSTVEGSGLALGFSRSFSTALMHGSATALVGIALGRLRYGRGASRLASLFLGWVAAMALHIGFNNLVDRTQSALTLPLAITLGLGGVGLVAGFIFLGLAEERRWLRETLGRQVGVSAGEAAVVQKLDNLESLLAPVGEHFGPEKRQQAEAFLKLQAKLGLKRKVQELTPDAKQRAEMARQVAALRADIDVIRKGLGIYCMSYIRSILPPESEPLWDRLGHALEERSEVSGPGLWQTIESKMEAKEERE